MSKKRKKYATGSRVENPNQALDRNNLAWQKAIAGGGNSPLTDGLDIFGTLAQIAGSSVMSAGASQVGSPDATGAASTGVGKFASKYGADVLNGLNMLQMFAYGGEVVPVNVEGNEVAQLPNGNILDFVGPSHEEGGIDVSLPEGTDIYSDRITFDGLTMAERKRLRSKRANKVSKDNDTVSKNTRKRTEETNAKQEAKDNEIQKQVKQVVEAEETEEFALGGPVIDGFKSALKRPRTATSIDVNPAGIEPLNITSANIPTSVPGVNGIAAPKDNSAGGFDFSNLIDSFTPGDIMGMFGNMYQARKPMDITKESRATDTPNINAYEDYGRKGLEKVDQAKGKLRTNTEKQKRDITNQQVTASKSNRNTARSVNQMRALDIATNTAAMDAGVSIEANYANQLINLILQEAGMLNQQDQVVMAGEQARDLAERQDKDAFYTQLAKDAVAYGQGLTKTGGSLNKAKERTTMSTAMNSMLDHIDIDPMTGKITSKKGIDKSVGKDVEQQLNTFVKNKGYESYNLSKKDWDALTKQEQIIYLMN